ncbi:MAG: alanine dehydrogenase, partial [Gammaproteobacteria bacterium]|nr:alanine dehydrogenase [Gammaproteobacteria bacterium]
MRIGIPREVKVLEGRVGLIPAAAAELVKLGHQVYMEQGAAILSGYTDEDYIVLGIVILPDARTLYETVEMIIKVKEPQAQELEYLRSDHLLFCYLHLSAAPELMQALKQIGLTAVAFETVEESGGELPLLAPMSDIAGRIAVQVGAHLLHQPQGGRGILMGGVPATERGKVVILGAGVAGGNAARVAAAMGAEVTVFNRSRDKLAAMRDIGGNVTALYAYDDAIRQAVLEADLLIGAVLVTGARAPHLVSADTVKQMKAGSV